MKSFWKLARHTSSPFVRRRSRRQASVRMETLEARQMLAFAIDDTGIAAQEGTPTVIDSMWVLANDFITTSGAVVEFDANGETDNVWNNTGQATNGYLNVDLGTPTLIDGSSGLSTSLAGIRQAYRFDGDDGGTFNNINTLSTGNPTAADASFELVFRPDPAGTGTQVLWESGGSGVGTAILYNGGDQSLSFIIDGGNNTNQLLRVDTAPGSVSTTEFTHLVGVYDKDNGPTDRLSLFLNGMGAGNDIEVDGDIDDWAGTNGDGIGTVAGDLALNAAPADMNFVGDMALIRVYPMVLSSDQVADNFHAVEGPITMVSSPTGAGATVTLNADQSITYDPNGQFDSLAFGEIATDSFTYTIADGLSFTSTATVVVTVVGSIEAVSGDIATPVDENLGATFQATDLPGQAAVAGAAVVFDADQETDGIWTNIGTATAPGLNVDLGGAPLAAVTDSNYPGIEQAYRFDGATTGGTFLDLETGVNPDPTTSSASFELVFRPDPSGSGTQVLLETGGGGNGTGIVYNAANRSLTFLMDGGNDGTRVLRVDSAAGSVLVNEFNHLLGVYRKNTDAANTDVLDVYLNGVLVGTATDDDVDDWAGPDDGGVGTIFNTMATGIVPVRYQGEMNLIRFYDRALSRPEVLGNYGNAIATGSIVSVTFPTAQGGTLTLNPDGTVDYAVPAALDSLQVGDRVTDTFTYTLDDGSGTLTTGTATFTINGANDAPIANDDMLADAVTDEETPITVPVPVTINESSEYAAAVLAQGPIGFWQLNETSGTVAMNQGTAGATLDGTYEANVTQGVAGFDPDGDLAAQFNDAADSQVVIAGYPGITGANARSVSVWINTTELNDDIVAWGLNVVGEKWTFRTQTTNGVVGALRLEVNGGYIVGNTVVADGQWHHVAFTFEDDGTPDVQDVKLYVDGRLDAELGGAVPPSASQSTAINTSAGGVVEMGSSTNDRFLDGRLDDIALFDRALTGAEIQAQFAATVPPTGPTVLDNDTDVEGDQIAIQSFDTVSVGGATISMDTLQSIGNVGMINGLEIAPQTISFGGDFTNPVVIAQPLSSNGVQASIVRLSNIDAVNDEFTVSLIESPDLDNTGHNAEDFFFIVLEAGSWQLADGTLLEVGTIDTSNTRPNDPFVTVNFSTPFGTAPAVLSQAQTSNETGFLKTRQDFTTAAGFDVILEEAQSGGTPPVPDADDMHASETIGYVAFSQGTSATFGGAAFEAVTTGRIVDETGDQVDFLGTYGNPPLIVAALASFTGSDPIHLRFRNLTNTGVVFEAQEDTYGDPEVTHSDEAVSYLAFSGPGAILAYPPGSTPGSFTYDPSGALDFVPAGEVYTDTFTYTIVDALGATATATVSVRVTGINDAPTGVDDTFDVGEDGSTTIDPLANDLDPDIDGSVPDDILTVTAVDTTSTVGTVTINPGGADVSYDPQDNFESLDDGETATTTFIYTLADGSGVTSTATVTVVINGANDAPVADAGGPYTIDEGDGITLDASASTDIEGDMLTYAWDVDGDGMFDDATGANPSLPASALQAAADGPGSFDVSVQVSDGDNTSTATVTVTVNNTPPVATVVASGGQAFPLVDFDITVSADDPSDADDAAPFTYELDIDGDGTIDQTMAGPGSGVTFTVQFPAVGTTTILAYATDKDGGRSDAATDTVNVVPVGIDGDGNLVAAGTGISDRIIITSTNTGYQVRYNNVFYPLGGGSFSLAGDGRLIASGAGGNDVILIATDLDVPTELDGGTGNDYLAGGVSDDTLIGGEGNDIILGGNGNNLIIGDTRDSSGLGGSDRLEGRNGNDTLFGGAGNDRLNGRGGDDILDGGTDNDFIFGDLGNDLIVGSSGIDNINGSVGNDVILGGDSADQMFGAQDQDLLIGGLGADRLRGDSGDDTVVGDQSSLDSDLEVALNAMLASMVRLSLADIDPAVAGAIDDWMTNNDRSGFEPFLTGDGATDDLTGGEGVDAFHAVATDIVRDFRDGDIAL